MREHIPACMRKAALKIFIGSIPANGTDQVESAGGYNEIKTMPMSHIHVSEISIGDAGLVKTRIGDALVE